MCVQNIICSRIIWLCYIRLNSADGWTASLGTLSSPCVRTVEQGLFLTVEPQFSLSLSLSLGDSVSIHQILNHNSTQYSHLNRSAASLGFIFQILCCFQKELKPRSLSLSNHLSMKPFQFSFVCHELGQSSFTSCSRNLVQ